MSPTRAKLALSLALGALLTAAIAGAVPLRVATLNVELGLGPPGTSGHDAAALILGRIDADVVALQEIQGADLTGFPSSLESLASTLGYPHLHLAETSNVLDSSSRVCFLSRYAITSATNIASPLGANDMARQVPAIVVDLPDLAADPTILTLHLKCCLDPDDSFRRAVELLRIAGYLETMGLTASDHVLVLGDFNLIGFDQVYSELPPGLPASYELGNDISFPVDYTVAPAPYFSSLSMTPLGARQLDGDENTAGSSVLDYLLATPALTSRPHASEIYNSVLDTSNAQGLPKSGLPLPAGTSKDAGDHLTLFADFDLASLTSLSLSISTPSLPESAPSGAAVLTITLPVAPGPGEFVDVTLVSSDPTEAIPAQSLVSIGPGARTLEVEIVPQADVLADDSQSLTFTASAPGFSPATVDFTVTDSSSTVFSLDAMNTPVIEDFTGFDGTTSPARWPSNRGPWRGLDDGSSPTPGRYSYGSLVDPSLGILLDGSVTTSTASFTNLIGTSITALQIEYDAEQWRSSQGGSADQISVELVIEGNPTPLPELSFTADPNLPSGPIPGGASASLGTVVPGLAILPAASFSLRFTVTPGTPGGGTLPSDVFLNELHYDNQGADQDEFLEIVVGPGFAGELSNLSIVLYNGSDGGTYATQTLDTFSLNQTTTSGHRIYSKQIPGIQNGDPDGIAIVEDSKVLHFLSYEGVLTATNGPASGLTSTNIGVAQSGPAPAPGGGSLGLTNRGGEARDFTWTRFAGPFTRGAINEGQSFTAPAGSQGIAIDNLAVTALLDTDLDGQPDLTDPDDDNDDLPDAVEPALGTDPLLPDSDGDGIEDGHEDADHDRQSNLAELLVTLTDPLDPNSRFSLTVTADFGNPTGALLSFPTLAGRTYTIERSDQLLIWTTFTILSGDGTPKALMVPGPPARGAQFFRVSVARP